jgi:hypothetical protein
MANTYDIMGQGGPPGMALAVAWIEEYCREHPTHQFIAAGAALITARYPTRWIEAPSDVKNKR